MNCANCGSPLAEGASFCTNCGQPVATTSFEEALSDVASPYAAAADSADDEVSAANPYAAVPGADPAAAPYAAAAPVAAVRPDVPNQSSIPEYQQQFYEQRQQQGYQQGYQRPSYQQQPQQPRVFPQPATKRALAMCLYAGLLPLIFGFAVRDKSDEFITFHLNQALVIFIGSIIAAILSAIIIGMLLGIYLLVMAIMGMVSAYNGDMNELPLIGKIKIVQ